MAKLEAAAADSKAAEEGARLRAEEEKRARIAAEEGTRLRAAEEKQARIAAEEGTRLRAAEEKQAAARRYEAEVNLREQELRLLRERLDAEERARRDKMQIREQVQERERLNREADRLEREGHRESERAMEVTMTAMTKMDGGYNETCVTSNAKTPEELPMYFENVEKLFTTYKVSEELKAKLLLPLLKVILSGLGLDKMHNYVELKEFLLKQFRLT